MRSSSTRLAGFKRTATVSPTAPLVSLTVLLKEWIRAPLSFYSEFHSWNAGPRSCPGRALATFEGITTITAILQQFDIILSDDTKLYEPLSALNMVYTESNSSPYTIVTNSITST